MIRQSRPMLYAIIEAIGRFLTHGHGTDSRGFEFSLTYGLLRAGRNSMT